MSVVLMVSVNSVNSVVPMMSVLPGKLPADVSAP